MFSALEGGIAKWAIKKNKPEANAKLLSNLQRVLFKTQQSAAKYAVQSLDFNPNKL